MYHVGCENLKNLFDRPKPRREYKITNGHNEDACDDVQWIHLAQGKAQ
jgi:hypothetical protein